MGHVEPVGGDVDAERLDTHHCLQRGSRLAKERADLPGHPGACRLGRLGYRPTLMVLEVRGLVPTAASQRQVQKQALRTSRS